MKLSEILGKYNIDIKECSIISLLKHDPVDYYGKDIKKSGNYILVFRGKDDDDTLPVFDGLYGKSPLKEISNNKIKKLKGKLVASWVLEDATLDGKKSASDFDVIINSGKFDKLLDAIKYVYGIVKNVRSILPIMAAFLAVSCTSIPKNKIYKDKENIAQVNKAQKKIDSISRANQKRLENSTEFKDCVKKIETLNKMKNKSSVDNADINTLKSIYGNEMNIAPIDCTQGKIDDSEYQKLKKEFEVHCDKKYWDENIIISGVLLPLRLTNTTLAIGTLGIYCVIPPFFCQSWYVNKNDGRAGFHLWAPGDKWNYDICKTMLPEDKPASFANKTEFNDANGILKKVKGYCKTEQSKAEAKQGAKQKEFDRYLAKLKSMACDRNDYKKGCLLDLPRAVDNSLAGWCMLGAGSLEGAAGCLPFVKDLTVQGSTMNGGVLTEVGFIQTTKQYFHGQTFQTDGYLYEYDKPHKGIFVTVPSFKRSKYKIPTSDKAEIEESGICKTVRINECRAKYDSQKSDCDFSGHIFMPKNEKNKMKRQCKDKNDRLEWDKNKECV
jgi:hypothetical protein